MKSDISFVTGIIISFLILALYMIYTSYADSDLPKIKGDCFDKHGNKINGVTCDIKQTNTTRDIIFVISLLSAFLIFSIYNTHKFKKEFIDEI